MMESILKYPPMLFKFRVIKENVSHVGAVFHFLYFSARPITLETHLMQGLNGTSSRIYYLDIKHFNAKCQEVYQ